MIRVLVAGAVLAASPAAAKWRTENEAVRNSAEDPVIASALAAMDAIDAAILAGNEAGFTSVLAADLVVNDPGNSARPSPMVAGSFKRGLIDYSSYDRVIDLIAKRPSGEVVAMGWEIVQPKGKAPNAGKTVRRRFTDVWRNDGGTWKLAIRQSTIVEVK